MFRSGILELCTYREMISFLLSYSLNTHINYSHNISRWKTAKQFLSNNGTTFTLPKMPNLLWWATSKVTRYVERENTMWPSIALILLRNRMGLFETLVKTKACFLLSIPINITIATYQVNRSCFTSTSIKRNLSQNKTYRFRYIDLQNNLKLFW